MRLNTIELDVKLKWWVIINDMVFFALIGYNPFGLKS
jgi:hypothetical protein